MAANTQGMDSHGNTKLPAKAAAEGSLVPEKEAVVEHMTAKNAGMSTSNLNGMNSHGDTVMPEKAAEANVDRHLHGLHPHSAKD